MARGPERDDLEQLERDRGASHLPGRAVVAHRAAADLEGDVVAVRAGRREPAGAIAGETSFEGRRPRRRIGELGAACVAQRGGSRLAEMLELFRKTLRRSSGPVEPGLHDYRSGASERAIERARELGAALPERTVALRECRAV